MAMDVRKFSFGSKGDRFGLSSEMKGETNGQGLLHGTEREKRRAEVSSTSLHIEIDFFEQRKDSTMLP